MLKRPTVCRLKYTTLIVVVQYCCTAGDLGAAFLQHSSLFKAKTGSETGYEKRRG